MSILGIAASLTLLYWLVIYADSSRGLRLFHRLPRVQTLPAKPPLVSVIIAAKEEEGTIRETVRHLLTQTYPRLEIIAVNDRSRDGTGVRLEELRKWSAQKKDISTPLQIIHITQLPEGWLGKNHALYQGYLQAKGQYLLFTDADILFSPSAIADAVAYMQRHEVQHLTLTPEMMAGTPLLRSFIHFFLFTLFLNIRPWRANLDHQRRAGVGIGAFNLVSRAAYEAIGTHRALALRPDDDLQLGALIKRAGFRQRILAAADALRVEWYPQLRAAIVGLEKNLFAGFKYSVLYAAACCLGLLLFFFLPWAGMLLLWDWRGLLYALSVIVQIVLYRKHVRILNGGRTGDEAKWLPFSSLLLIFVIVRAVWLTLRQGGIYWRGTFYSLKALKKMRS